MDKNYFIIKSEYYISPNFDDNDVLTKYTLVSASYKEALDYLINVVLKDILVGPWTFSDSKIDGRNFKDKELLDYIKDLYKTNDDLTISINYIINKYYDNTNNNLFSMTNVTNTLAHYFHMPTREVKYFNKEDDLNTYILHNKIEVKDKNKINL